MSITTYAETQTAVANYLARSDLTSYIPDFIAGAETRVAYGGEAPLASQALRIRSMEEDSTFTVGATSPLPTGFLQMRALYLTANGRKYRLEQTSHEDLYARYPSATGIPQYYAVSGDDLVFGPEPSGTYTATMLYYKKFDPLATASPVPWLLTNAPLVYVYGALLEASPFLRNDDRLQTWYGMFTSAIGGLMRSDRRDRWSGSVQAIRPDTGSP